MFDLPTSNANEPEKRPGFLTLGIETSCDETSAAVLREGREILSVRTATQDHLHEIFGGVVPEVASRRHVEVVTRMVEKPENPPSDLAIVGVYGFGPQIWEAVDSIEPSARGELEITDAIDRLVAADARVECHVTDGFWADAGSPDALLRANQFFLKHSEHRIDGEVDAASSIEDLPVTIADGASVRNSQITGPVWVGPGAVVDGCSVGPDVSIGADCRLSNVNIDDSIIDIETVISDVKSILRHCVLGQNVTVRGIMSAGGQQHISMLLADESTLVPSER